MIPMNRSRRISADESMIGARGAASLAALLHRRALLVAFALAENLEPVLKLLEKYSEVPMSLAGILAG